MTCNICNVQLDHETGCHYMTDINGKDVHICSVCLEDLKRDGFIDCREILREVRVA